MKNFGFKIAQTRQINLDTADAARRAALMERVPSFHLCIGCGGCTATCTAGQLTDFNIRRLHTAFACGQTEGLREQLDKCMLCGKCVLVCPRGVNTRGLIMQMRALLAEERR